MGYVMSSRLYKCTENKEDEDSLQGPLENDPAFQNNPTPSYCFYVIEHSRNQAPCSV